MDLIIFFKEVEEKWFVKWKDVLLLLVLTHHTQLSVHHCILRNRKKIFIWKRELKKILFAHEHIQTHTLLCLLLRPLNGIWVFLNRRFCLAKPLLPLSVSGLTRHGHRVRIGRESMWEGEWQTELEDVSQLLTIPESHGCCHDDVAAKLVMLGYFAQTAAVRALTPWSFLLLYSFIRSISDECLLFYNGNVNYYGFDLFK